MMTETDRLLHRVRAFLAQPGVTKAGLARKAGLHQNALRDADEPGWNPLADTLRKIEPHLPPEDGFAEAAAPFDDVEQDMQISGDGRMAPLHGAGVSSEWPVASADKGGEIIGEADSPVPFPEGSASSPTSSRTCPSCAAPATDPRPLPSLTGQPFDPAQDRTEAA